MMIAEKRQNIIEVYSPLNQKKIGEVKVFSLDEAKEAIKRAKEAQKYWGGLSLEERCKKILDFADVLYKRAEEVARLISSENGKTIYESYMFEIIPVLHLTAYFARNASRILSPKKISISVFKNRASYIHYKPRGTMLVISPWNFPLSIPGGEVIMGLIAGNAVILKPASLTPLIAVKLRELFDEAGLNKDIFQVITGPGALASQMIETGEFNYVNFTGSTRVGREVASLCGKMLIPCSMELGGKDAAIVCHDADIDAAARSVVWGAFANSGQICASIERAYVHESIYDEFVQKVVEITKSLRQDNPIENPDADIGAMTDKNQIKVVERHIEEAKAKGAIIHTGGKRSKIGEMYFEPTVMTDVDDSMSATCEESFGPLLPIMKFKTEDEAIERANNSCYGLTACVYTKDQEKGKRIAERLEAGTVMINDALMTHAFPETPWMGVKESGIGRVHSDDGLRDLCVAYHVNYEVIPMKNMVWYPYSRDKVNKFFALLGIIDKPSSLGDKFKMLKNLITGK
ncbi:MAG: aldehyde dehydrogenase family protein [Myxococcota bacterium]